MENLQLLLPEIFLSLSIMFLLILGVFKNNSSKLIQNLSLIILIITAVVTFNETIGISNTKLFYGINSGNYKKLLLNKADFLAISGYIWNNKKAEPKEATKKLK